MQCFFFTSVFPPWFAPAQTVTALEFDMACNEKENITVGAEVSATDFLYEG